MTETIMTIIMSVLTVGMALFSYYLAIRRSVKDKALDAINNAEDELDKSGEEKMQIAVESIYATIPTIVKPLITKEFIQTAVQLAFNKVKEFAQKQQIEEN